MPYVVSITSPAERETLIAKSLVTPERKEPFHHFRSKTYYLDVIRVSIDLPIYRMENFRTYTHQHGHLAKEGLAQDYFLTGQEIQSVQQVQHNILADLSKKGVADSVYPVIKALEKQGQRYPLLMTSRGVIVNGNRRLAAMRELGFSHVEVMVLPADASADEIVDIEASLQGVPDTKLEYDWIGDAQLINRLLGMGRTTKQVADQLHRNVKDIENTKAALAEADLYLKEWANAEGEYARISDDAKQIFRDLPKRVERKDAALAQASRVIAWSLFENKEMLGNRVYEYREAFGTLASDVLNRMAEKLGVPTTGVADDEFDDGDFDVGVDDDPTGPDYTAVINALRDDETRPEAIDALIQSSITAVAVAKGQKDAEAALKALAEANAKIVSVDLTRAAAGTYSGIRKQLEAIESLAAKLKDKLDEIEKAKE